MILDRILEYKKEFVKNRKSEIPLIELKEKIRDIDSPRNFKNALAKPKTKPGVIAEIKKASPSKGIIREDFQYLDFAKNYEENKASAISVLTDEYFFKGSDKYLEEIKKCVSIPVLRKDFIIDEYQIFESLVIGADAILLIVRCLSKMQLEDYLGLAQSLHLNCLVEVHKEKEAEIALDLNATIIGVNNRNLDTFEVDLNHTANISEMLPEDIILVSESGIKTKEDVQFLMNCGADAILVGETFMKYKIPGEGITKILPS